MGACCKCCAFDYVQIFWRDSYVLSHSFNLPSRNIFPWNCKLFSERQLKKQFLLSLNCSFFMPVWLIVILCEVFNRFQVPKCHVLAHMCVCMCVPCMRAHLCMHVCVKCWQAVKSYRGLVSSGWCNYWLSNVDVNLCWSLLNNVFFVLYLKSVDLKLSLDVSKILLMVEF